jgi:hypothetical protein
MRTLLLLTALALQPAAFIAQTTGVPGVPVDRPSETNKPISAVLTKDIDARHIKVGDTVKATAYSGFTANGTRVPPGSELTGHVTDVATLGRGSIESRIGVVFDAAQLRGKQTVALHMGIAGLAAAPPVIIPVTSDMSAENGQIQAGGPPDVGATAGGLPVSHPTRSYSARVSHMPDPTDDTSTNSASNTATRSDRGTTAATVGSTVPGISLRGSASSGTVLFSTSNNIALRSGTPLALTTIKDAP